MNKMTPAQERTLRAFVKHREPVSAYGLLAYFNLHVSMATIDGLVRRGFLKPAREPGHMSFPRSGRYMLTGKAKVWAETA